MPIGVNGPDRSGNTTKNTTLSREAGKSRATDDPYIFKNIYGRNYNEHKVLQENNVARNEAIPNGEAQTKHSLSKYADDEKRWLVTTADKERSKSAGFKLRLKRRWGEQHPDKKHISKQKLRDNAARFRKSWQ